MTMPTALDRRDWASLDNVFADETANYAGAEIVDGRESLTGMIRGYLDKCGPTQHFMGHERAVVDGDRASVSAKMRVHHNGADRPDLTFEVFGWYHAEAARTPKGWRTHRFERDCGLVCRSRCPVRSDPVWKTTHLSGRSEFQWAAGTDADLPGQAGKDLFRP